MTKTNLRAYNREIESLIDRNKTDEAIAHCKYILKIFPKNVDTYRLLGKAYLENRRYSDAADLFWRVLSVVPDDFISQIGMSIIREDEGNFDTAIWHMERAFEIQPSNAPIQDELRRLYGRRDGIQPPKVRLTRGALVRMYARGELYPQAIAEAKLALSEDASRVDIEILQARMHNICNQKSEAAEICNRIISKLPFCLEANQILFDILPENAQEERKVYQQRLFAINPYLAYMTPSHASVSLVPDGVIQLESLEYSEELNNQANQPEWAQSVGADLSMTEDMASDWLPNNASQFIHAPESTTVPFPGSLDLSNNVLPPIDEITPEQDSSPSPLVQMEESEDDGDIPDWMRAEGWVRSNHPETQPESLDETQESDEAIEAAEIPEWLQGMAPAEISTNSTASSPEILNEKSDADFTWLSESTEPKPEEEENPAWLSEVLPQESPIEEPPHESKELKEENLSVSENMPGEQTFVSAPETTGYTGTDLEADLSWFEKLGENQLNGTGTPDTDAIPSEVPEWLQTEQNMSQQVSTPDTAEPPSDVFAEPTADDTLPDWLKMNLSPSEPIESETEPIFTPEELPETTPDVQPSDVARYENDIAAAPQVEETTPGLEELLSTPENVLENIPEWIATQDSFPEPVESETVQVDNSALSEGLPVETEILTEQTVEEAFSSLPEPNMIEAQETPSEISPPDVSVPEEVLPLVSTGLLEQARQAIETNNYEDALVKLTDLIQKRESLDEVIDQLLDMAYRQPVNPNVWQTLGDAHFQANHLQAAIDAYTKAEELIR